MYEQSVLSLTFKQILVMMMSSADTASVVSEWLGRVLRVIGESTPYDWIGVQSELLWYSCYEGPQLSIFTEKISS